MKFVLDTNIILSALIKDSLTRKIITNLEFEFFTPSFSFSEIEKYRKYICKKTLMTREQFDILLENLFENIEIIPISFYEKYLDKSKTLIDDTKDIPFLACAIALNIDIWSDDKHFKKQKKVKVFTTEEFVKRFLKKK